MEKQKDNADQKRNCFVISPIGKSGSPERKNADLLLKYIIAPVMRDSNYEFIRSDQITDSGIITKQIIGKLIDSKLVIADLTGHNPNVLYELAIRHAIKKPFIHVIKKGEQIPFDIATTRTIYYELDLDSVDAAKNELQKMVTSCETTDEVDNPIAETIVFQALIESQNPKERSLAEAIEMISGIKSIINRLDNKIEAQTNTLSYFKKDISNILKPSKYENEILVRYHA